MSGMRILYGVVGEGMGHAMRSAVVLEQLFHAGHEVRIVVSGRAAGYLAKRHPGCVVEITGLVMAYEDNVVKKRRTLLENIEALKGVPGNLRQYIEMIEGFAPNAVISDFESWSYMFARSQQLPVISVDNMQIIARCHHEGRVLADMKSFLLAKGIVKAKLPRANSYLATTFFYPRVKRERTSLHPPILRPVILEAKARVKSGDHLLVYQSGTSHGSLEETLRKSGVECRVYGLRRDISETVVEGNIAYRPFSETAFIEDLATARAVVAGGGFTLMGEAVYLQKPMLSVPLVGQFEQSLNAAYLADLGYGEHAEEVTPDGLRAFLSRTSRYLENLAAFEHDENRGLFTTLDRALASAIDEGPLA